MIQSMMIAIRIDLLVHVLGHFLSSSPVFCQWEKQRGEEGCDIGPPASRLPSCLDYGHQHNVMQISQMDI